MTTQRLLQLFNKKKREWEEESKRKNSETLKTSNGVVATRDIKLSSLGWHLTSKDTIFKRNQQPVPQKIHYINFDLLTYLKGQWELSINSLKKLADLPSNLFWRNCSLFLFFWAMICCIDVCENGFQGDFVQLLFVFTI